MTLLEYVYNFGFLFLDISSDVIDVTVFGTALIIIHTCMILYSLLKYDYVRILDLVLIMILVSLNIWACIYITVYVLSWDINPLFAWLYITVSMLIIYFTSLYMNNKNPEKTIEVSN